MSVTDIDDAKTNLSRLIEAAERGEEVIIARDGKPTVRIVSIAPPVPAENLALDTPGKRIAGMWKDRVKFLDPDWETNDEEFIDLFYDVTKFEKGPNAA